VHVEWREGWEEQVNWECVDRRAVEGTREQTAYKAYPDPTDCQGNPETRGLKLVNIYNH
jgi:hypothetical protein